VRHATSNSDLNDPTKGYLNNHREKPIKFQVNSINFQVNSTNINDHLAKLKDNLRILRVHITKSTDNLICLQDKPTNFIDSPCKLSDIKFLLANLKDNKASKGFQVARDNKNPRDINKTP
jgi:hypothetical protein